MHDALVVYLPYLLSPLTIAAMLVAGDKRQGAWAVGLLNQLHWLVWIGLSGIWGLLPMNLALWVVCARNYLKWDRGRMRRRQGTGMRTSWLDQQARERVLHLDQSERLRGGPGRSAHRARE